MSSPDFRAFVDGIIADHRAWLTAHSSPSGTEFLDHYVGSASQPSGLLWQFEAWRTETALCTLRPARFDFSRLDHGIDRHFLACLFIYHRSRALVQTPPK